MLFITSGTSQLPYLIERQLLLWFRYTKWFLTRTTYTFSILEGDRQASFLPISNPLDNPFYQVIHLLHPRESTYRNCYAYILYAYTNNSINVYLFKDSERLVGLNTLNLRHLSLRHCALDLKKKSNVFWKFKERAKRISLGWSNTVFWTFWCNQGRLHIC